MKKVILILVMLIALLAIAVTINQAPPVEVLSELAVDSPCVAIAAESDCLAMRIEQAVLEKIHLFSNTHLLEQYKDTQMKTQNAGLIGGLFWSRSHEPVNIGYEKS